MTPTPKPPPEIAERHLSRDTNAPVASFQLGELEMAFAQLIGPLAAARMSRRLRLASEEDLADDTPVSLADAATLLLDELSPSGGLRSPLALTSAVLEGGGVQSAVAPRDALDHPALRSLIRPSLHSFCEALLSPDCVPVEPFPVESISMTEAGDYQGAQVRLILSRAPDLFATLSFGAFAKDELLVRDSAMSGHLPFLIGYVARELRHPLPASELIERAQIAMATARAADAVLH